MSMRRKHSKYPCQGWVQNKPYFRAKWLEFIPLFRSKLIKNCTLYAVAHITQTMAPLRESPTPQPPLHDQTLYHGSESIKRRDRKKNEEDLQGSIPSRLLFGIWHGWKWSVIGYNQPSLTQSSLHHLWKPNFHTELGRDVLTGIWGERSKGNRFHSKAESEKPQSRLEWLI